MHREGIFEKHRLDAITMVAATLGAGPIAQGFIGPVPQGYAWYVENLGFQVVGNSHTAAVSLVITPDDTALPAVATWDGAGTVATIAAAVRGQADPGVDFYLPPAHYLHVYCFPGTLVATDVVTATAQIAVHQLDPRLIVSPEDQRQLRAAYAHLPMDNSVVNQPATAGARATDTPPPGFALNEEEEQPVFSADYRERS